MARNRQSGMRYRVDINGVDNVIRQARILTDPKKRIALMKKAIRAGGAVLLKYIRQALRRHDRTGWLRKTLKSKLVYFKKSGILTLIVGVQSKASTEVSVEQRLGKASKYVTRRITSHKYAHLVLSPRKAFTQQITYTNRLGTLVRMKRRIAAYGGDNVFESASKIHGAEVLAKMQAVITEGITLI